MRFLLIDDGMDPRLAGVCQMANPTEYQNDQLLTDEMRRRLQAVAAIQSPSSIRLSFEGPSDCGQAEAAALLASTLELRVLQLDLSRLGTTAGAHTNDVLQSAVREAWLRGAVLHVKCAAFGEPSDAKNLDALWLALRTIPVPFVIESESAWVPAAGKPMGVVTVHFSTPAIAQRDYWWRQCLS